MHDPLSTLLADGVIDEVSGRLKSGKEADLWLVRCGGEIVAAKIYKARHVRSFRNNAAYKEGRQVRDTRTQRAMNRGSRFGQAAAEEAWKSKEADALYALHAAGVRVPKPILFYEGVLLMELVRDAHGQPAPRLIDAHLAREHAAALYADLRGQAVRMLACDLIHGDLSAYNVLLGRDGPVVIDFPQVVGAAHNSQAESFFRRDLENLRHFFASLDPAVGQAANDAREIWRAYVRRELTPEFVPSGRGEAPREVSHQRAGRGAASEPPRERAPRDHRKHGRAATHQAGGGNRHGEPHRSSGNGRGTVGARRPAHPDAGAAAASHAPRGGRPTGAAPRGGRPSGAPPHGHQGRGVSGGPEVIRVTRPLVSAPRPATPGRAPQAAAVPKVASAPQAPQRPAGTGRRRRRRRRPA